MNKTEQRSLSEAMETPCRLADLRHGSPASKEAQAAIGEWYAMLNGTPASPQAFAGLGQLYVSDERFENIDKLVKA